MRKAENDTSNDELRCIREAACLMERRIRLQKKKKNTLKRGFPGGSDGKESACNEGLENSMDSIVHGVAKSRTRLSDFHFTSLLN